MHDVFSESFDEMTRATDPLTPATTPPPAAAATLPSAAADGGATHGHVCPFCGLTREITPEFDAGTPCPRCTLADTPTTRNATKARVGPWHVRQVRNPWAPGMRFETLLALIKRGQVTRDSIVRGPTTHQLWKRAAEIKGLSREFALCYSCGGDIDPAANLCPHCNRLQEPPVNPDVLIETRESAAAAAAASAAAATAAGYGNGSSGGNGAASGGNGRSAPATTMAGGRAASAPLPRLPQPDIERPRRPGEPVPHIDLPAAADDPADLLSVSEEQVAMARQITSRPPKQHPEQPAAKAPAAAVPQRPPRPMNIRPVPPGADDALLTPQELAAAFQLDFAPDKPPRKPTSKGLVLVLLLLLIAGGLAALAYLRPDLRQQGAAWGERTYGQIKTFIASRTSPAPPAAGTPAQGASGTHGSNATKPKPQPVVVTPAPQPATPQSVAVADPSPAPAAPPAVLQTPEPPPAKVEVAVAPSPAPAVAPAPSASGNNAEPASTQTPPTPAPAPAKPEPVPAPPPAKPAEPKPADTVAADPSDEARRLWRKGIDAEANQDYAEAVNCYEQIKKLPADVQPWGLDVRLELAKKMVK